MSARHTRTSFGIALALLGAVACAQTDGDSAEAGAAGGQAGAGQPPVVEVTAEDFEFDAPRRIASGWTTFRFTNSGEEEHFFILWRLPEGKTLADYKAGVVDGFTRVWNRYASGAIDRGEAEAALGEELPEWFFAEAQPSGGAALTEPGETSQVTLELEPGTYAMECYVKTPQGTWHTERGMLRGLTVATESNGASPPEADVEVRLSNYEIATSGELAAGTRTVAVHVEENPEGFMAHDLNLVRLDADTDVQEVVAWMDWMDLDQFRAPAPGYSLGGVEHLAAGRTAYFTVDLEPGRYAWVSEGYGARGMVEEFTVE